MDDNADDIITRALADPGFAARHIETHGSRWATVFADWAGQVDLSPVRGLDLMTDMAWAARSAGVSAPTVIPLDQLVPTGERGRDAAMALFALQGARFDFDHRRMQQILGLIEPTSLAEEQLGDAFMIFVRLAAGEDVPDAEIADVAPAGAPLKIQHLVLHGLWLSPHSRYGGRLVDLGTRIIRLNPADANAWMRRADGHRRRSEYMAALDAIDTAIYHLPPDQLAIHDDFARQRLFITTESQLHDKISRLGEEQQEILRTSVSAYGENLRSEYHAMLFRVMEILALFTALIGLLAAAVGASVAGDLSMWERIGVVASASVFLMFFFIMIRILARPRKQTFTRLPAAPTTQTKGQA